MLLENGSAYKCFCSERRLEILRKEALKLREIPKYDNKCRYLTKDEAEEKLAKGEKSCVRFKVQSITFINEVTGNNCRYYLVDRGCRGI